MRFSVAFVVPLLEVFDTTFSLASASDQCRQSATQTARDLAAPCSPLYQANPACHAPFASSIPIALTHQSRPTSIGRGVNWKKGKCGRWSDRTPAAHESGPQGRKNPFSCPSRQSLHKYVLPHPSQTSLHPSSAAISRFSSIASNPSATAIRRPFANSTRKHEPPVGNGLTSSTGKSCAAPCCSRLPCFCR